MKASVFVATSLDGYIARPDGGLDWLPGDDCEPHGYNEFMASVDAVVIGRLTYETVLAFGGWAYGKKRVIVLSASQSYLPFPDEAVAERMSGAPQEIVAQLEERGIGHIYVDGGITVQGFLRAGLIQRMVITRIPVLLGAGIPLFGPLGEDLRFDHVTTKTFRGGMVQSEYVLASREKL